MTQVVEGLPNKAGPWVPWPEQRRKKNCGRPLYSKKCKAEVEHNLLITFQ